MVLCSSGSEIGIGRSRSNSSSFRIKMAPKPHSITNMNKTETIRSSTRSETSSKGFRLQDDNCETGSVYSLYKQKIDLMFSDNSAERAYKYQQTINNCVQARIEKMFSDITKDVDQKLSEISSHSFTVDYLGSVPLTSKVTSLSGLQEPLKDLYFAYRKNLRHKHALAGRLEISSSGLKVYYQGEKGDLEQLNTFPTIAVWSAVKFVLHKGTQIEYAFLPLITDPDNIDKQSLFKVLGQYDKKYITHDAHSPLFAVVMRKIGVGKQLECHGFVCQTSEDAIVIAATLYKSLMSFMNRKNNSKTPKNRNGISCISIASSNNETRSILEGKPSIPIRPPRKKRSSTASSIISDDNDMIRCGSIQEKIKQTKSKRAAPKIPDSNSSPSSNNTQDLDAIVPYPDSSEPFLDCSRNKSIVQRAESLIRDFNEGQKNMIKKDLYGDQSKQLNNEIKQVFAANGDRGFQRAQSIRKSDRDKGMNTDNSGDILTKVTIPRSGSFLNAKGLTRYKSNTCRSNGQNGGGSPIGFSELFNEFRQQEGLTSVDEILGAIIDSEGMSFNDLKPIYKEFLLKLAVTLTKDELYQRSKSIMRRQKKKLLRRNSSNQNKRKKMILGAKGLKKVFYRSVKFTQRFRNSKNNSSRSSLRRNSFNFVPAKKTILNSNSSISTSSYDTRHFQPKEIPNEAPIKSSYRKRSITEKNNNNNNREKTSTSEDSDFFTLQRNRQKICNSQACNTQNRNSSSGYVSCSECSYDSDSCTCVSADKCYCSLGNKTEEIKHSLTSCKSDDKCYCSLDNGGVSCTSHKSKTKPAKLTDYSKIIENTNYQQSAANKYFLEKKYGITPSHLNATKTEFTKSKKCYCSNDKNSLDNSLSWCGCDTDSCSDSNKCYCQSDIDAEKKGGTIFEQLRARGFIPSTETVVTPPRTRKVCKRNSTTKSSKSLEYLQNPEDNITYYESIKLKGKPNPLLGETKRSYSSDNLALDYELFTVTNGGKGLIPQKTGGRMRTNSESALCSVFKTDGFHVDAPGTSDNSKSSTPFTRNNETLSVKKSAEIAAMFTDVRLSQTTDITHIVNSDCAETISHLKAVKPVKQINTRLNSHLEEQRKLLLQQQKDTYKRMVETDSNIYCKPTGSVASRNSSVMSRGSVLSKTSMNSRGSRNSIASRRQTKSTLFSAQNGLYTIQSQSDDSRRSSASEKRANSREFFAVEPYLPTRTSVSGNLENGLGYLP